MPIFTVQLKIDGQLYGSGQGHSIKVAETLAAQRALKQVGLGCKNNHYGGPWKCSGKKQ